MRKILSFVALLITVSSYAQENNRFSTDSIPHIPVNEFKMNLVRAIFEPFFELSYERILSEDFALGTKTGVSFIEENNYTKFQLIPYANWYLNGNSNNKRKYAAGFFIQANLALNTLNTDKMGVYHRDVDAVISENITTTTFGVGMAIGWKFISRNYWICTITLGGGRNIWKDINNTYADGYAAYGISVGKRF